MEPELDEGPLPRLDALPRRVGEWLLIWYGLALILMTFGGEQVPAPPPEIAQVENLGHD